MKRQFKENPDSLKEVIKLMTPMELFDLADEDDSGYVSFEEFRGILPLLGMKMADAKAYRLFIIYL